MRRTVFTILLTLAACGPADTTPIMTEVAGDDLSYDVQPDVAPDAGADQVADLQAWDEVGFDGEAADFGNDQGWIPGPGEAGYPCSGGFDCNEGYCIQTPDGMQCTVTCQEECPFGWECVQYAPSLPDQVFICGLPGNISPQGTHVQMTVMIYVK